MTPRAGETLPVPIAAPAEGRLSGSLPPGGSAQMDFVWLTGPTGAPAGVRLLLQPRERFAVDRLPPGRYRVELFPGEPAPPLRLIETTLGEGERKDLGVIESPG